MTKQTNDPQNSLLQKHLDRAQDLGVELDEYSAAYNVDFDELRAAENQPDLSDFVAVKIAPPNVSSTSALLTLTNHSGQQMIFHEWPPTEILERLWSCNL